MSLSEIRKISPDHQDPGPKTRRKYPIAQHRYEKQRFLRVSSFSTHGFPCGDDQVMVYRSKNAVVAPVVEIPTNRRDRRKVIRQHAPLTTGGRHVQNGIKHITQVRCAWPASRLCWRQQWGNMTPFFLRRVACISASRAFIIREADFSPHLVHPHLLRHKRENHK